VQECLGQRLKKKTKKKTKKARARVRDALSIRGMKSLWVFALLRSGLNAIIACDFAIFPRIKCHTRKETGSSRSYSPDTRKESSKHKHEECQQRDVPQELSNVSLLFPRLTQKKRK